MSSAVVRFVHIWEPPTVGTRTLLALHGRGGNEHDLVAVAHVLAPGAGVLAPRGPELQPPGFAWFLHRAIGVPIAESFDARLSEVDAWLEVIVAEYGIVSPITALGFSNGGMMAGALVAARPDLVDSAILMASGYALPERITALGGLGGRRILICGGDEDPFHPPDVMRAGVASYRAAGAQVSARVYPGVGHTVTSEQARDAAAWLAEATP